MADDHYPDTSLDDDWCSISEAARRLSVTPTAIRNRIKRGTLEVRPNGNFGRLVRVPRTVPDTVPDTVPLTVPEPVLDQITDVLVRELRERVADLQARAAAADAERTATQQEAARERLAAAQEREKLHTALVDTTQRLDRLHEARQADLNQHRQEMNELQRQLDDLQRRPWWRRIWAA
ncbi:hypothetical protein KBI52_02640 [Microvirga sp. HBU67558]|uniref:hypothetical protein n=1 Tax=Microvirga TaxID=186650 RepID=UPI001B36BFE5|nr:MULTISPECIES: hypothetical protein [unclassified Microvirga]MBQ0819142.1 hypothetical protein [Microvirga sp. HBU67558]